MKLIAITDNQLGIAKNKKIFFQCKEDLDFFKQKTINHVVIMGKTTWESIKHPLKNRINIVISNSLYQKKVQNNQLQQITNTIIQQIAKNNKISTRVLLAKDLTQAVNCAKRINNILHNETWLIGGKTIYDIALKKKLCKQAFITMIDENFQCDLHIHCNILYNKTSSLNKSTLKNDDQNYQTNTNTKQNSTQKHTQIKDKDKIQQNNNTQQKLTNINETNAMQQNINETDSTQNENEQIFATINSFQRQFFKKFEIINTKICKDNNKKLFFIKFS